MNRHLIKGLSATLLLAMGGLASGGAAAATLNDIYQVAERINQQASQSQARVDSLTEETRALLSEYKTVLKEIEGLRVYNRQLERQIESQEQEMAQLTRSVDEVTVIERQITPLMMRMIDGLEQFVELDLPFLLDERRGRVEELRTMMDRADVAVSEKFSQILRAYQTENEYGRTIDAYGDTITVDGNPRKVDILQIGRVVLAYQSPDGELTGFYNPVSTRWEELDDSYDTAIRNGIRMARQQLSVDMLTLPVRGPVEVSGPQAPQRNNQTAQAPEAAE
jgi:cell division protein FtsB